MNADLVSLVNHSSRPICYTPESDNSSRQAKKMGGVGRESGR